jgi:RHS repeat-associated protein
MLPLSSRLIPRLAALWLQAVVLLGLAVASATGRPVLPSPAFGAPWGVQDRLTGRLLKSGMGLTQASFSWQHDAVGSVTRQDESWAAAGAGQPARSRSTVNTYDLAGRLAKETITEVVGASASPPVTTTCSYDAAHNRTHKLVEGGSGAENWAYTYNVANQLTQSVKTHATAPVETTTYGYDANGNRTSRDKRIGGSDSYLTLYQWNAWDRLMGVNLTGAKKFSYTYDDRARRVAVAQATSGGLVARYTAVTFSGGLSVAEFESTTAVVGTVAAVQYIRGPDMGGGVGGLLRTVRNPVSASTTLPVAPTAAKPAIHRYNLSNGRGDIVAQSNAAGEVTWTASYEAYGKRTKETGANADKQRANTKDEDPTGLLNEGFRYRDLETGVWLSRDPAGFVDGPNLYAYVQQNPWSKFDAEGMFWSAIITAGFAAYDTYQYATGQTSGAEYSKAMALNGAALLADVSTGGMGGGLAVRALNAGVKVAKVVDKANNIVETAQAAVETTENIVSAVQEGDGRGVMRAAGAGILGAITDRAMGGKKGSGADQLYEVGRYKDMNKRNGTENHHTPGKEAEKELLGGDYDAAQDVAIRLPASAHRGKASEVDAVETLRPSMVGTPANGRELLAREIRVLRAATDAPNSALQKIIDTKKIDYPQHYGDEAKRLNKPPKD